MAIEGAGNTLKRTQMNLTANQRGTLFSTTDSSAGLQGFAPSHEAPRQPGTRRLSVGLPGAQIPLDAFTRLGETQLRSTSPPPHITGEG